MSDSSPVPPQAPSLWTRFSNLDATGILSSNVSAVTPVIGDQPTTGSDTTFGTTTTLAVIASVLVLLTVVTFVSTGSVVATLVVIAILIGFILLLNKLGYLKIYTDNGTLHVEYHQTGIASAPAPAPSTKQQTASAPKPVIKSEVFHVGGNQYTYEEAPAVCAAYDAELATYDQVNDALTLGAEWCAYGWSQGGMALFPTQETTWQKMQSDPLTRTNCGRPGVNGGYFDPATKFGVNCFGVKPPDAKNLKYPLPLPGMDPDLFDQMVKKFKSSLEGISVNAFNRMGWSAWNLSAHT